MCGRFTLTGNLIWLFNLLNLEPPPVSGDRFNIAPSQPVLALLYDSDRNRLACDFLTWGLVPPFVKDPRAVSSLINARAETLAFKPSFKNAFRYRRCILPASGFYEWKKNQNGSDPYYFFPAGDRQLCLAAIWEIWHGEGGEQVNSCAILTVAANAIVKKVHERMPAIIEPDAIEYWLSPETQVNDLQTLLRPAAVDRLNCRRVSRMVNSPRNDCPECIEPAKPEGPFQPDLFNNYS